jgi:hypothetical protein
VAIPEKRTSSLDDQLKRAQIIKVQLDSAKTRQEIFQIAQSQYGTSNLKPTKSN